MKERFDIFFFECSTLLRIIQCKSLEKFLKIRNTLKHSEKWEHENEEQEDYIFLLVLVLKFIVISSFEWEKMKWTKCSTNVWLHFCIHFFNWFWVDFGLERMFVRRVNWMLRICSRISPQLKRSCWMVNK
jgi:hypothetical protein